ncbi:MAG: 3D domain-containing protein [Chthoniobacterales bacterium]
MKRYIIAMGLVLLGATTGSAREQPVLARVTVYWASGGNGSDRWTRRHQAATRVRLRPGHCAVDPRRIPYGSKVFLPDATLVAVDTGRHVRTRRAARRSARSSSERNAIVIDRFFETKSQALSWARRNPRFMRVHVQAPGRPAMTSPIVHDSPPKPQQPMLAYHSPSQPPLQPIVTEIAPQSAIRRGAFYMP